MKSWQVKPLIYNIDPQKMSPDALRQDLECRLDYGFNSFFIEPYRFSNKTHFFKIASEIDRDFAITAIFNLDTALEINCNLDLYRKGHLRSIFVEGNFPEEYTSLLQIAQKLATHFQITAILDPENGKKEDSKLLRELILSGAGGFTAVMQQENKKYISSKIEYFNLKNLKYYMETPIFRDRKKFETRYSILKKYAILNPTLQTVIALNSVLQNWITLRDAGLHTLDEIPKMELSEAIPQRTESEMNYRIEPNRITLKAVRNKIVLENGEMELYRYCSGKLKLSEIANKMGYPIEQFIEKLALPLFEKLDRAMHILFYTLKEAK